MATFERLIIINPQVSVKMVYDDVIMKLISVDVKNSGKQKVYFKVTSPVIETKDFASAKDELYNLPTLKQASYTTKVVKSRSHILGIDWSISLQNPVGIKE